MAATPKAEEAEPVIKETARECAEYPGAEGLYPSSAQGLDKEVVSVTRQERFAATVEVPRFTRVQLEAEADRLLAPFADLGIGDYAKTVEQKWVFVGGFAALSRDRRMAQYATEALEILASLEVAPC